MVIHLRSLPAHASSLALFKQEIPSSDSTSSIIHHCYLAPPVRHQYVLYIIIIYQWILHMKPVMHKICDISTVIYHILGCIYWLHFHTYVDNHIYPYI